MKFCVQVLIEERVDFFFFFLASIYLTELINSVQGWLQHLYPESLWVFPSNLKGMFL